MVKDISTAQNVLALPVGSEMVWKDFGSGAGSNLAIYRLIPPTGYKCLGHVTVGWPVGTQTHSPPELNNYRCVKSEYLEDVQYESLIWDTRGTGELDHIELN